MKARDKFLCLVSQNQSQLHHVVITVAESQMGNTLKRELANVQEKTSSVTETPSILVNGWGFGQGVGGWWVVGEVMGVVGVG